MYPSLIILVQSTSKTGQAEHIFLLKLNVGEAETVVGVQELFFFVIELEFT